MFETWGLLGNTLILLISILVMDRASDWTIVNSVKVADITGFGKTTVGFLLIALSTSLPELFVSIFAALSGEGIGLAVGNIIGSNIANICLILGVCLFVAALKVSETLDLAPLLAKEETGSLYFGLFVTSIIPLALCYIGYASRFIGVALLGIFVYYVYQLSKVKKLKDESSLGEERRKLPLYVFLTFFGAILVVISAYLLVESASYLAVAFGIPPVVVGETIIAFGTSLPELVTSVNSVQRGHLDLALGNIIGSCFTNTTLILGATLVSSPFTLNMMAFTNLVIFSIIINLMLWYFLSSEKISWREGVVLLFLYVIFMISSFSGYKA